MIGQVEFCTDKNIPRVDRGRTLFPVPGALTIRFPKSGVVRRYPVTVRERFGQGLLDQGRAENANPRHYPAPAAGRDDDRSARRSRDRYPILSAEAMAALMRLKLRPRLDGTAKLVLSHLCWRHDTNIDATRCSQPRLAEDLDLPRNTLIDALNRLLEAGVIVKAAGGGRGRATRYGLPFVAIARVRPEGNIELSTIYPKQSGGAGRFREPKQSGGPA